MYQKIRNELIGFAVFIAALFLARELILRVPAWEYWNYPLQAYNVCLVIVIGFLAIRILWLLLRKKS